MKPTNKLPTPSEAGLPDNVLREVNQAVASSLQHDEGRRGYRWQEAKVYSYVYSRQGSIRVYTHDRHEQHSLGRTGVP